jgi:hypothetical protein
LWRRPRPKLGCGAKERKKKKKDNTISNCVIYEAVSKSFPTESAKKYMLTFTR